MVAGCRIPKSYFVTTGFGETDSGGGIDPWETGRLSSASRSKAHESLQRWAMVTVPQADLSRVHDRLL